MVDKTNFTYGDCVIDNKHILEVWQVRSQLTHGSCVVDIRTKCCLYSGNVRDSNPVYL